MKLYKELAKYYDLLFKPDYYKEARTVNKIIKRLGGVKDDLLDIGCGTGGHMIAFKRLGWKVEGLDDSEEMLAITNKKVKGTVLHKSKMQSMKLDKNFEAITLLNRTLLFAKNKRELKKILERIWKHLVPKGVLVMDLDAHEQFFDSDKSETNYFSSEGKEGSITEEYDQRGDKILWSINLSIKMKGVVARVIDNQEFLMINVRKLLRLLREIGYKPLVYDFNGEPTNEFNQALYIGAIKVKKK